MLEEAAYREQAMISGRYELPGNDLDDFTDEMYRLGWTDGLPVVPPSVERVERFVAASGRKPDELIASIEPRMGDATVEVIAANAVMAGCRPEYMPVVIAMVRAAARPEFNLAGLQTTSNPVSPMVVVNGQARLDLEMNGGRNALGPGNRANATLGRALRLILINVGGSVPGSVDKATLGMPGKYTFCFAEDEENSAWAPLSVDRGLARGESAVSLFAAQGTTNLGCGTAGPDPILTVVADGIATYGSNNYLLGGGQPVVILPPGHADLMSSAGWSKLDVQTFLYEKSAVPLDRLISPDDWFHGAKLVERDGKIYACASAADLTIVIAGGPEPYHITYAANFGDSTSVTEPV